MSLFIESDEDEAPDVKRQKLDDLESESAYELSSDSEWDDIDLPPPPDEIESSTSNRPPPVADRPPPGTVSIPDSFTIPIDTQVLRQKRLAHIETKKKKVALHNLGLVLYILYARHRNLLLAAKNVHRSMKKLLPSSLTKKVKTLFKSLQNGSSDLDVQLIYILKYFLKWFRLNFKIVSNGLRVLGYLPNKSSEDYFVNNSTPIRDEKDMIHVVKKFKHNRDVAAQIFTGLLRSVGFNARLVFSLPVLSSKDKSLQPKLNMAKLERNKDYDLLYPYFWTEVVNPIDDSEIIILESCAFHDEEKRLSRVSRIRKRRNSFCPIYFPVQDQFNSMKMNYVISLDSNGYILDTSARYMKNISYRWFDRLDLRSETGRSYLLFQSIIRSLNRNTGPVVPVHKEMECLRYLGLSNYDIPQTKAAIKRNPNFTTFDSLRYDEVIAKDTTPLTKTAGRELFPVFFRNCVIVGKSEQQWKFLGRSVRPEEINKEIKSTRSLLPRTIARKRIFNLNILNKAPELNSVKLYSFGQTCPYIKPKVNYSSSTSLAILPRNKFGNIEIYKPNMVPDDCTWIQLSEIEKCLREKLNNIQFVPVITGFSFKKNGFAIPLKNGVIVLDSDVKRVKHLWLSYKIEQYRLMKEQKLNVVLDTWRELLKKLKIKSRLDATYNPVEHL